MSIQEQYKQRLRTAEEAIRLVKDGDFIVVPTGPGEAPALLSALSTHRCDFHDVKIGQILPIRKYDYFDPETVNHVRHVSYFLSGTSRPGAQAGWVDAIPHHFSELPTLMERGLLPSDVVFTLASPMDKHGYFSLGLCADYTMAAIAKARAVVLEVNANVPYTYGNCHVHISQVAALVENDTPLIEFGLPQIGPVQEAIGRYVADLIEDGSTLQIGYGAIPDAVVMQLAHKHDLGVHTEMMGDGLLSLIECGALTNRKKNYLPGKGVATFCLGSKKLYEYMDRNRSIELHPVNFTNDPYLAGKNDKLVAINATMQIDLFGQCGSESIGHKPYSGTGGQSDFVRAANRSKGGKSFIALPSTAKDGIISRIVPTLSPGTYVSTSKNDINYVVTEFGVAQLRGKSIKERVQEIISIAHPEFRAELMEEAKRMALV